MNSETIMPGLTKALRRLNRGLPIDANVVTNLDLLKFSCERVVHSLECAAKIGDTGPIQELEQHLSQVLYVLEHELGDSLATYACEVRRILDAAPNR